MPFHTYYNFEFDTDYKDITVRYCERCDENALNDYVETTFNDIDFKKHPIICCKTNEDAIINIYLHFNPYKKCCKFKFQTPYAILNSVRHHQCPNIDDYTNPDYDYSDYEEPVLKWRDLNRQLRLGKMYINHGEYNESYLDEYNRHVYKYNITKKLFDSLREFFKDDVLDEPCYDYIATRIYDVDERCSEYLAFIYVEKDKELFYCIRDETHQFINDACGTYEYDLSAIVTFPQVIVVKDIAYERYDVRKLCVPCDEYYDIYFLTKGKILCNVEFDHEEEN